MALNTRVVIDRVSNVYEILDNGSSFITADASQTIQGIVKIEIDTGSGYTTAYDNTDYTNPNFSFPVSGAGVVGALSNDILKSLITDVNGVTIKGTYKFTLTARYLNSAVFDFDTQEIVFNLVNDVNVNSNLTYSVNTLIPQINLSDTQTFVVNGVTPTFETSTLTLNYPETSGVPPLTVSTVPFTLSTNNVWTKGYSAVETVIALYDFTTYLERIKVLTEESFEVINTTLCQLYDCISTLKDSVDHNKKYNTSKYQTLLGQYIEAMAIATQVQIAMNCGETSDVTSLLEDIASIINASDCSATCGAIADDSPSVIVKGSYNNPLALEYAYLGIGGTIPTSSDEVLALDATLINNGTLFLETGAVETLFVVALPPTKTITSVIDIDAYNADITSSYVYQGVVAVVISGVAYNYGIWAMTTAVPYSTSHTHKILVS